MDLGSEEAKPSLNSALSTVSKILANGFITPKAPLESQTKLKTISHIAHANFAFPITKSRATSRAVELLSSVSHAVRTNSYIGQYVGGDTIRESIWRCDMHPAFSNDGQFVAYNGKPTDVIGESSLEGDSKKRRVIVSYIGAEPQELIH